MSTVPTPIPAPSKLQTILNIIQIALSALGPLVPGSALAEVFLAIFRNATALYQAETGQPFDITKIPQQTPLP